MNKSFALRVLPFIILLVACVFMLLPVLKPGFLMTDDGEWMVVRLSAFYQSFREGQFPVRFLGRLNHSYGYPVSNFLYPGYLYLGSLLRAIGLPFQMAIEGIIIGSVVVGAIALFFWLRHFFGKTASMIGVGSFIFMPYLLYDIYKRGSIGEILAIAATFVVLLAIEKKWKWLVAPSVGFLAISHNTLALFFVPILLTYIVIKKYWNLVSPFFLGIGMSLFFWLPAFFEKSIVLFDSISVSRPSEYLPIAFTLILKGLPFLFAAFASLFVYKNSIRFHKERLFFLILLFGGSLCASKLAAFLWNNSLFVQGVQFPYRFLALGSFAGPWFIAYLADKKNIQYAILSILCVSGLFALALPYQKSEMLTRPEGFFTTNEGTTTVANEYMPKWASMLPVERAPTRLEFYQGNADISETVVTTDKIDISIQAQEDSILQINTLYYPGWGAMLDNKPVLIAYDNPMGIMRIHIPTGNHRLYMAFRETTSRFAADMLSLVSIIMYFLWYVVKSNKTV